MRDAGKPYSILKLHDFNERCWGVVDRSGALIDHDGMSLRLTKEEAQSLAQLRNSDEEGSAASSRAD